MGCHTIGAKGGKSGPDLSKIGAKDKSSDIAAKIKNPKANNPNSIMPASHRPDKEIAATIYISPRTVQNHLTRIREKTGLRRRTELTRWAIDHALT